MTLKGSNSIYSMHTIHMIFNNFGSILIEWNLQKQQKTNKPQKPLMKFQLQ